MASEDHQTLTRPARVPARTLFLVGALLSALAGLDAAMLRLGLRAPVEEVNLANSHGVLMVYGFLGTAICLERAIALQSTPDRFTRWAYLAPAASGLAALATILQGAGILPPERFVPALLWAFALTVVALIYAIIWRKQPAIAVLVQGFGAVAALGGILLWGRGYEVAEIIPWWTMFLVLTIVGERLELARIAFLSSGTEPRILAEACVIMLALPITLLSPQVGYPLLGAALLVTVVDVAWHDVARRTIRSTGLPRFMAACMLSGYAWALVAAGIWIVSGPVFSGYTYDTVIHSVTIGFALSMVLAHAPVIVPAIARRELPYRQVMWAPWVLLQGGLLVRVLAGARDSEQVWQFGGALDVIAVLLFAILAVTIIVLTSRNTTR